MFLKQFSSIAVLSIILVEGQLVNGQTPRGCVLPEHPSYGLWSVVTGTNSPYASPGYEVPPGTSLNVQCQTGYTLQGPAFIICVDKAWSAEIGKCQGQCPPITSTSTTRVTCINPIDKSEVENCTKPTNGTIARLKCAQFYENEEINKNPLFECRNGNWTRPIPRCAPQCGIKSVSALALIIGGTVARRPDFPWHVSIYEKKNNTSTRKFRYICAGNLINERVILTVAHCIMNEDRKVRPKESLLVAVGKFQVNINGPRDPEEQISKLKHGFIAEGFNPAKDSNFFADLAILVTEKTFVLSKYVLPICIDWTLSYENLFTQGIVNGTVVGWSFAKESKNVADELVGMEVPYTPYDECSKSLSKDDDYLFTNDKLCVGYSNKNKSVCSGDSGRGLVIRNTDRRYYLVGVATLGPSKGLNCNAQQKALYTKISSYTTSFIYETEKKFRPESVITRFVQDTVAITHTVEVISQSKQLCGLRNTKVETLIIGGKNSTRGEYPWQIAIYDLTKQKQLICGGSLIHQRIVLTAAHCVTDQSTSELNSKERYMLAAGKYYRDYDDPRDINTQFSPVKEIFVPPQYEGDKQNYIADIAILISEEKFILSKYIQTVCIDWDQKYENKLIKSPTKGFVSGWGSTEETGKFSPVLKELEVPYVDRHKCKKELPVDYDVYLTFDKICSGYLNKSISVCSGDSGGGLVFRVPDSNSYYIAGIVSLSPRAPTIEGGCDQQQYSLYTRVSHYITSFILSKFKLYFV